jgi:Development and cell death domain
VKEGMYLFLFNTDDRNMCGVFKAASDGRMNIIPEAFSSSGSSYPAQVES